VHQQLGVDLGKRIPEVADRGDPRAMDRVTRPPEYAVDRLDGITSGAQYNERNRVLFALLVHRSSAEDPV
jgi:hypothetical protein